MSKQELVQDLQADRDQWLVYCDAITANEREIELTKEGWRLQDFVGHLSFWEQQTLNHIRDTLKQGRPTPFTVDVLGDELNGRVMDQHRTWSWGKVRGEFENTRNALIQRIEGLRTSDLEFYLPSPWVEDHRILKLETLIREDVLEHSAEHREETQAWLANRTEQAANG